jgi:hypothetical protein
MLAEAQGFTLSFERKIVELKVLGREETINEHLAKLLAFEAPPELRESWKRELVRKHLVTLAAYRLKPGKRLVPRRDWWAWLYDGPFEGNEEGYAEVLIAQHEDEYLRNDRSAAEVVARIRDLHAALADRLARGDPGADLIEAL